MNLILPKDGTTNIAADIWEFVISAIVFTSWGVIHYFGWEGVLNFLRIKHRKARPSTPLRTSRSSDTLVEPDILGANLL